MAPRQDGDTIRIAEQLRDIADRGLNDVTTDRVTDRVLRQAASETTSFAGSNS